MRAALARNRSTALRRAQTALAALTIAGVAVLFPAVATAAPSPVGAQTATSATTSITVTRPAGVVAGDVLVGTLTSRIGAAVTISAPAGWTLVRRDACLLPGTQMTQALYYRVASSSEPASASWTLSKDRQLVRCDRRLSRHRRRLAARRAQRRVRPRHAHRDGTVGHDLRAADPARRLVRSQQHDLGDRSCRNHVALLGRERRNDAGRDLRARHRPRRRRRHRSDHDGRGRGQRLRDRAAARLAPRSGRRHHGALRAGLAPHDRFDRQLDQRRVERVLGQRRRHRLRPVPRRHVHG